MGGLISMASFALWKSSNARSDLGRLTSFLVISGIIGAGKVSLLPNALRGLRQGARASVTFRFLLIGLAFYPPNAKVKRPAPLRPCRKNSAPSGQMNRGTMEAQ